VAPYFFGTRVKGGTTLARYNVFGYIENAINRAGGQNDIVGVAGMAKALAGGDAMAFGLYGEGVLYTTSGYAMGAELQVNNLSGSDAPAITTTRPAGSTIAAQIVAAGTKKNSAGIAIISTGDSATCQFITGIVFLPASFGSYGIDFLGMGAASPNPIRLANNTTIVARNAAGNANVNLIGLGSDNIVYLNGMAFNQAVATVSSPTFAGLTLTGFSGVVQASAGVLSAAQLSHTALSNIGTLTHATIDTYLDQAVLTSSTPTFAGLHTTGDIQIRSATSNAGKVYFGADGNEYIGFDGTYYRFYIAGTVVGYIDVNGFHNGAI
jgi:hypothetical protein